MHIVFHSLYVDYDRNRHIHVGMSKELIIGSLFELFSGLSMFDRISTNLIFQEEAVDSNT